MTAPASHSSIGEVLALLQAEYPDVTISKIRFLESQGLLNPERTPSGYRKFHDEDIERLRWILTQQRDHFLPLKVIKERLLAGDFAEGPPEGVLPLVRPVGSVSSVSSLAVETDVAVLSETILGGVDDQTVVIASAHHTKKLTRGSVATADITSATNGSGSATPSSLSAESSSSRKETPAVSSKNTKDAGSNDRARAVTSLLEGPATPSSADPVAPRGRKRHPTGHTKGEPTPTVPEVDEPDLPPLTLTLEELCAQSGLTPGAVAELERFDLLKPRSMGPVEYYDDDALTVARLAAGFGRFGIEPRHLRMYKVSAEREAGLFEQLITPLLKQRRAAARDQAVEMLEELAELADDLRAVMVRVSLQEYLGQS